MGKAKAELLSLVQLRCFVATVKAGSFTGAARILDVTQPAVAEHVRNLEGSLAVDLFIRAGRGVRLTPAGVAFADRVGPILGALDEVVQSVDAVAELRTGELAFGLFSTPEAYDIDRLASTFARQHSGLSVRLLGQNSSIAADRVRDGDFEAALVALPVDDRGLVVEPIARDEVVYASSDPDHTRRPLTIELLTRRELILYEAESGDRDPLRRQLVERAQELGVGLVPRIETQTMVMALRLAADGLGDTYIPRAHTRASYFPANLTTTTFDPPVYETFATVARRGVRLSPATKAFVAALTEHMRRLGGLAPL